MLRQRLLGFLGNDDVADLDLGHVDDLLQRGGRRGELVLFQDVHQLVPAANLAFDGAIDFVDRRHALGMQAGVHEDGLVDLQDRLACPEPAAVLTACGKSLHVFDEPEWMRRHPLLSGDRHPFALRDFRMGFERPAPPVLGTLVRERGIRAGGHVAQVAQDVHAFVVAEQHVHAAAGAPGLALEPHQQVHDLSDVVTAIGEVAGLHEPRVPAAPSLFLVDQAGCPEDLREAIAGAVNVADCHDSRVVAGLGFQASDANAIGRQQAGHERE